MSDFQTVLSELWQLIVAYFKQEAVEPIKALGRFVAFGLAGSLLLAIGVTSLTLAALRALQTETGTAFTGNLSWAPYVITLAVGGLAAVAFASRISVDREKDNT